MSTTYKLNYNGDPLASNDVNVSLFIEDLHDWMMELKVRDSSRSLSSLCLCVERRSEKKGRNLVGLPILGTLEEEDGVNLQIKSVIIVRKQIIEMRLSKLEGGRK